MLKQLYAVYDTVSEQLIGSIIIEVADAPAIRAFHDALKNKDSLLAQHPEDFNLVNLAGLDPAGYIRLNETQPQIVATGSAWKESQNVA